MKAAELVIRSIVARQLSKQTYEEISDFSRNHDFNLDDMETVLKYMVDKYERAQLVTGEKTNVKV